MSREENIAVYNNTVAIVKKGVYMSPKGKEVKLPNPKEMADGTKFYGKRVVNDYDAIPRYETEVKVIDIDCIYAAKDLIDRGFNPCMLNMASFSTPGGGVIKGSSAQEEDIFRRTNIFRSLYQFHSVGENFGVEQREERYPLDYNFGGIYTPHVTVFKGGSDTRYTPLEEPFEVGVVSVSAVKNPTLHNGKLEPWVIDTTKSKIRQILTLPLRMVTIHLCSVPLVVGHIRHHLQKWQSCLRKSLRVRNTREHSRQFTLPLSISLQQMVSIIQRVISNHLKTY